MFKKILLVDDSITARMVIKQHLQIVGCQDSEFIEAKNGKEALDSLKEHQFGLIVTDMNMPVMDGNEFLKRLKSSPKYNKIPVIIISSAANQDNKPRFMSFGANYVIPKPVSPQLLHEAIKSLSPE